MKTKSRLSWNRYLFLGLAVLVAASTAQAGRTQIDAWPLLEIDEDTTTILYPLYSHEGESFTSFPLYYRTNEGRDHHVLWPLVKLSDGHLERAAPFWFAGEEEYTFFPFIHRTKYSTTLLVPPVHWRHDGDLVAFLPFYVRSGQMRYYAPTLFVKKREGADAGASVERVTFFPLFDYERPGTGSKTKLNVLLLAHAEWSRGRHEMMLVPLAGFRSGTKTDYVWLGPYYRDGDRHLLAPLYYQHSVEGGNDRWILTWRERRSHRSDVTAVYPFYADSLDRLRGDRERRKVSAMWPVYHREEVRDADGKRESRRRRFLMFTDERRADGVRRFELFGLPISETVEEAAPPRGEEVELETSA
jgi:hypothetical protein